MTDNESRSYIEIPVRDIGRYRSSSYCFNQWEWLPASSSSRDFIHSLIDEVYEEASSFLMEEKLEDVEDVDPDQLEKLLNKEFVYG